MKISIITINYNNKLGLEKTIKSVVDQAFTDFEYIIIDGGSSDDSKEIIEKYKDKIDYWVSEKDKGIYNAMNKGIKVAKGEYLLFLNSGDNFTDKNVVKNVFLKAGNEDIIYGDTNYVYADGSKKVLTSLKEEELTLANFNTNNRATISHPSSFIKRNLFDQHLYDENYKIIADIKFFIEQIIFNNCTVKHLPFVISDFYLDGLSSNPENWKATIKERNRIFEEFLPPRVLKDYELIYKVRDSKLLAYIPLLNKTTGFQNMVSKVVGLMVAAYKLFKK